MVSRSRLLLLAAAFPGASVAVDDKPTAPCTATATNGKAFYDLRPDIAVAPSKEGKHQRAKSEDYTARGFDYGYNFTLNICEAVLKPPEKVVGVEEALWKNVSAYYQGKDGKIYSVGQQSSVLTPRGTQLVLQYTGGSTCGASQEKRDAAPPAELGPRNMALDVRAEEVRAEEARAEDKRSLDKRRKSATISFRCDRESVSPAATVSFVGADPDECSYMFVVRSQHACAGVQPSKPGSVGPGGVFALIFFIAIAVYFAGGIMYQRTVANARGWKQLPNYSLWAGIWNFVSDTLMIVTSSCARFMPSRRGYRTLSLSPSGRGMGRSREDEDRLIGQLDEEWDD